MSTFRLGFVGTVGVCGTLALAVGCSSSSSSDAPVNQFDAKPGADAPPSGSDAPSGNPDAPAAATYSGTIAVNDIMLLDEPTAGHGGQINIDFTKNGTPVEGSFTGPAPDFPPCDASYVDVTKASENNPSLDEGTVTLTGFTATVPPCTFIGDTYRCASAMGTGGNIAAAGMNGDKVFVFTDSSAATTFMASQVGQWLLFQSGLAFPIAGVNGNKLALQNVGLVAAPTEGVGAYLIAAGIGPQALQADTAGNITGGPPDFLNDGDKVTVALAAGGGNNFTSFSNQQVAAGKSFTLDTATLGILTAGIDLSTTSPVTLGCGGAGGVGCGPGTAAGTIVVIDTSDADTYAGATDFPGTPKKFTASLTCAAFDNQVSIPAGAIAILKAANPTKMRITVFRDNFLPADSGKVNIVAGHGVVKFQTVP